LATDLRVVDASGTCPHAQRDRAKAFGRSTSRARRSSTSTRISDRSPTCRTCSRRRTNFASRVKRLGLGDGSRIVVYDQQRHALGRPRCGGHFRAMGHEDVFVLDGGLPKWRAEGRPVEDGPAAPQAAPLHPRFQADIYRSLETCADVV
jgi:thiosulfate/3-mercaptopyruvate sulfurtransferase